MLQTVLIVLQDRTKELLENVQSSELWAITHYAHRVVSSSTRDISQQSPVELGTWEEPSPNPKSTPRNLSYAAHDVYFGYFYPGALNSSMVIDANAMTNRWKFHPEGYSASRPHFERFVVDETACSSSCLWLLASLALALEINLMSEDAAFALLSEVFDRISGIKKPNSFSNGPLTPRLKEDINYWISFAKSRGMQDGMSEETFDYVLIQDYQKKELMHLLMWVLSRETGKFFATGIWTRRPESGPARTIARSLRDVLIPVTIDEFLFTSQVTVEPGKPTIISRAADDVLMSGASLI